MLIQKRKKCRKEDAVKNIKGSLILLLAAFIWGIAFVAQTSGSQNVGTFTFNASRSFVGAAFLVIVIMVVRLSANKNVKQEITSDEYRPKTKWPIKGGIICGCVLCTAMSLQQYGISIYPKGVAASGRAGFLTATYVVMVAVLTALIEKKIRPVIVLSVIGCISGMYLLCMKGGFSGIYAADICLLLCAVCFMCHIFAVEHFSSEDGIKLSCIQFATCAVISLILALVFEKPDIGNIVKAAVPILYAGVMSNGIAYTLQIIGQKYTKPAVASIVMSLESVFAVLAGWLILHEVLSIREAVGCVLVFAAVIIAQIPEKEK